MGLFKTQAPVKEKETTVRDCINMIEDFLGKVGLNPKAQRLPDRTTIGWWVQRGSVVVYIIINRHEHLNTVRVVAPVVYLPEENILPLYRRCLEINMGLLNCALAVTDDQVVMVSERPIKGLDQHELEGIIDFLSGVADELDNKLEEEFNAPPYTGESTGE